MRFHIPRLQWVAITQSGAAAPHFLDAYFAEDECRSMRRHACHSAYLCMCIFSGCWLLACPESCPFLHARSHGVLTAT